MLSALLLLFLQQGSMSHVGWGLLLLKLHRLLLSISHRVFTAMWDRWMAVSPAGLTHQLLWCVVFVSSCEAQAAWLSTSHGVSDRAACPPETWPASRSAAGRRSRNTSAAGRRVVVGARPHEQLRKLLVANFGETVEKKGAWKVHLGETSLGFRIHEQS